VPSQSVEAPAVQSYQRRLLLRGGLGAAPVVLAAMPRSVLGTTHTCQTGSAYAMQSVPTSHVHAMLPACSGNTPEEWAACSLSEWPSSCLNDSGKKCKLFDEMFGTANGYGPSRTLRDVAGMGSGVVKDNLARHVVAALLNCRKGLTPSSIVSESTIREIWTRCSAGSYYEPTAAVQWYAGYSVPASSGGVIQWLRSTMS
jgi:hypothetical protein